METVEALSGELGYFYEMLLAAGSGVIGSDAVKEFTSRQRVGLYDHTFRHKMDRGLGFMIDSNRYGPDTVPYSFGLHASPGTFGHSGSQSAAAFTDPEYGLAVTLVCNGMPREPRHNKRALSFMRKFTRIWDW